MVLICIYQIGYKAFRHVETLFVQGNQVRTDQNKPSFLVIKKEVCFDQYELDYLGLIKFLHVERPYWHVDFFYPPERKAQQAAAVLCMTSPNARPPVNPIRVPHT